MAAKPARIWLGTIPYSSEYNLSDRLNQVRYAVGQREIGVTGYEHWQLVVYLGKPGRLSALKKIFGDGSHWEPTRSDAAESYVRKTETSVPDTQFEHGSKPLNRNSSRDWDAIKSRAIAGDFDSIPSDVYVRCYNSLRF